MSLIITLELEPGAQSFFNALREKHFPGHANYLDAHITLFHKLPGDEPAVHEHLERFAVRGPMLLEVSGVKNFGKGVAYNINSPELDTLHVDMQQAFWPWLIRQDRLRRWPHITIQNKVTAFKASCLHEELLKDFTPFSITATGLLSWQYLKGPWKALGRYPFTTK
ncbi:2'-5' RNA ligase family protein [uncultured Chitinophaga sp.]|uniref:2'-5' RNA ligase family protein n=1 Tax=uncultured Chitinophaga sp. TaxID=339340 RepID=UPI0025F7D63F|nr:2'-5' RNA ligase family protein [uncultured Chitinophaga sp.]